MVTKVNPVQSCRHHLIAWCCRHHKLGRRRLNIDKMSSATFDQHSFGDGIIACLHESYLYMQCNLFKITTLIKTINYL